MNPSPATSASELIVIQEVVTLLCDMVPGDETKCLFEMVQNSWQRGKIISITVLVLVLSRSRCSLDLIRSWSDYTSSSRPLQL